MQLKIPDGLLVVILLPPLAALLPAVPPPLPAVPEGFVGDVLPRATPDDAFAAAAPPRVEGELPLPPTAGLPRAGKYSVEGKKKKMKALCFSKFK